MRARRGTWNVLPLTAAHKFDTNFPSCMHLLVKKQIFEPVKNHAKPEGMGLGSSEERVWRGHAGQPQPQKFQDALCYACKELLSSDTGHGAGVSGLSVPSKKSKVHPPGNRYRPCRITIDHRIDAINVQLVSKNSCTSQELRSTHSHDSCCIKHAASYAVMLGALL